MKCKIAFMLSTVCVITLLTACSNDPMPKDSVIESVESKIESTISENTVSENTNIQSDDITEVVIESDTTSISKQNSKEITNNQTTSDTFADTQQNGNTNENENERESESESGANATDSSDVEINSVSAEYVGDTLNLMVIFANNTDEEKELDCSLFAIKKDNNIYNTNAGNKQFPANTSYAQWAFTVEAPTIKVGDKVEILYNNELIDTVEVTKF